MLQGRLTVTVYSMRVRAASFTTDMTLNGKLMSSWQRYLQGKVTRVSRGFNTQKEKTLLITWSHKQVQFEGISSRAFNRKTLPHRTRSSAQNQSISRALTGKSFLIRRTSSAQTRHQGGQTVLIFGWPHICPC